MGTKTLFEYESYCICLCAGGDNLCEGQGLMGKFVIPVEGCQAHCMGSGLKKHLSQSLTAGFAWAQHLPEVGRKWWTRPCHGQGLSHYSELRAYRESNSSPWGGGGETKSPALPMCFEWSPPQMAPSRLPPSGLHLPPQVAPLCLAASGLRQSLLPPLCENSWATEAACWLCLPAWHTLWIQTSPAHWRKRKEMLVKITAVFGWFLEPKRLYRQLSLAAAGDGFHTRSA